MESNDVREGSAEKGTTRNPPWTREEIILALDTYFHVNIHNLSIHEDPIVCLSDILQKLNAYQGKEKTDTYRNPSGVHMKLMNFYSIEHPGKGLRNASKLDKIIYNEFENDKSYLNSIAKKIINALSNEESIDFSYDDEGFIEGSIIEGQHKQKERNRKAVETKKESVLRATGHLKCEVCGFGFEDFYGDLGHGYIECHHIVPLADIEFEKRTKLEDLALVCSNCHRMLHRKRPWITIEKLREIIRSPETI